MCRFLLIKSKSPVKPEIFLHEFAKMAKKSRAFDGDWQGDGWGLSWLGKDERWYIYKSLKPIWTESKLFDRFSSGHIFVIHARSASFIKDKHNIEYNQPFINQKFSFVFNGLLKGVKLSSKIPGEIGAQKIWYLLKEMLNKKTPKQALEEIKDLLLNNSKQVQALNIGLADKKDIYALCYYSKHAGYYQLRYYDNDIKIICSEKIGNYQVKNIIPGGAIML